MALLTISHLQKIYVTRLGGNQVEALHNVNFSVEEGEYVAIMGESGSGKTTLLNILAALDRPTSGRVDLNGVELSSLPERQLSAFRRDNLGFVFQDFNLLDTFTLQDNILLPLVLQGVKYREMEERLIPIVEMLGIADLVKKYPYEVSGGQKQRAAVARALITNPQLIWRTNRPVHSIPAQPIHCCGCLRRSTSRDRQLSWSPIQFVRHPEQDGFCFYGMERFIISFIAVSFPARKCLRGFRTH